MTVHMYTTHAHAERKALFSLSKTSFFVFFYRPNRPKKDYRRLGRAPLDLTDDPNRTKKSSFGRFGR